MKKNKLLAALVNYGEDQISYLNQVVKELKSFKKYEVTIIVNSNIPLDISGIDRVNVIELPDYQLLPLTCRQVIWDYKDDFDVFLFGENDMLFKEHHIDKHIEYTEFLPDNRIAGFLHYEEDHTGKHFVAMHSGFDWDYGSVEEHNGKQFAYFSCLHQATLIITKDQLHKIGKQHDFTKFFGKSQYSSKCQVGTDIFEFCNMKKLICISEFEDNIIQHLPIKYIYHKHDHSGEVMSGPESVMREQVNKLLNTKNNMKVNTITSYEGLAEHLIDSGVTMLWKELFDLPIRNFQKISSVDGDIVECGVWRGGCSIFLSLLFNDKNIWCCDSYEGFQPLDKTTYDFDGERHTPAFSHCALGPLAISLDEVKQNFEDYGLLGDGRIQFLKGFVNETLPTAKIEKISILRLDVDSYSATLDILDNLYPKVQPGGFIIFDDANLTESFEAIKHFLIRENLPLELHNPYTDEIYSISNGPVVETNSGFHSNSYIIKK